MSETMSVFCPSCGAHDSNPYIDGRGIAMRACWWCRLQWQDQSVKDAPRAAAPEMAEALRHLLEHTEHKGNACKLLAVGKAQLALAAYEAAKVKP